MARVRGGVIVRFTVPQFNAVTSTLRGELESLTEADRASGAFDDLAAALDAMTSGRQRKDARRKLSLEQGSRG